MNVYAVLIVVGQTVASIGPWPAGIDNCRSNIPASNQNLDKAFADPGKLAKLREKWPALQREQVEWTCVESATRPEIKDAVRLP